MQQENYNIDQESESALSLREIVEIGINNWYWFLLSVVVCLVAAFFYVKSVKQTYVAEAIIMIKTDDPKKGSILSESAIFSDMGLGSSGTVVENEIFLLRSTSLMATTVKRLNIDVTYSVSPLLRNVDIYGTSPIEVEFPDRDLMSGVVLDITILTDKAYQYSIRDINDEISTGQGIFGSVVSSRNGRFNVKKTPSFTTDYENGEITVTVYDLEKRIKNILSDLTVTRTDKITGVLKLSLRDCNYQRSKDILNTLITVYNENVIDDKNRVATNTEKFIYERISTISEDLGGIDGQIEQYKKDNQIVDFPSSSGSLVQMNSKYKEEIVAVETEISLVKFIKEYLSDPLKKNGLIPSNTGVSDLGIETQISKYNEERLKLDKLLINSGENNPVTKELINTLNVTKANMVYSIDNFISSLQIKKRQLNAQENIANRRIEAVPTQEKMVNDIVRQQKIKESLYLYLLNKREENALNLAITESNAKIVESANGDKDPVAPVMMLHLLIALMLGFSIPAAIIFIKSSLDNKVHSKRDVELYTTIPVIGELPKKRKDQKNEEILIMETGRDRISEAFRVVRSNMDFISGTKEGVAKVIQFTSTMPSEGKTYTTVNLALSYAHTGKKVLVMDMDLRKGKMSRVMGVNSNIIGSSSYLSGRITNIDQIICKNVINSSLDFISTGPIPPNPANLLMSDLFENMINELKLCYDYIFIDTVPAMIVADATIINRVADVTIYVIRNSRIDRRYLKEIEKMSLTHKFKNMSILLTDVDVDSKRYGYGYGYGYGYVDGEKEGKGR